MAKNSQNLKEWWNNLKAKNVFLHKIYYRKADEAEKSPNGFYNVIFKKLRY